jgi:SAM-dependent methyltransferase
MGLKLNLGAAKNIRSYAEGWRNCDIARGPGIDVSFDFNGKFPFDDGEFEYIWASHILEHLTSLKSTMMECHRVLKVGGVLEIYVPYGPIGVADINDDPEHKIAFCPTSLRPYYTDANTSLDYDWKTAPFKCDALEVIRIFWQRERLSKVLGSWIAKRYVRPKIGIPVEIHFLLRKVS